MSYAGIRMSHESPRGIHFEGANASAQFPPRAPIGPSKIPGIPEKIRRGPEEIPGKSGNRISGNPPPESAFCCTFQARNAGKSRFSCRKPSKIPGIPEKIREVQKRETTRRTPCGKENGPKNRGTPGLAPASPAERPSRTLIFTDFHRKKTLIFKIFPCGAKMGFPAGQA